MVHLLVHGNFSTFVYLQIKILFGKVMASREQDSCTFDRVDDGCVTHFDNVKTNRVTIFGCNAASFCITYLSNFAFI